MAQLRWQVPKIEGEAVVVVFDMCCSSAIVDDLTLSGNVAPYMQFLDKLKHALADLQSMAVFRLYKFTGDGWILLYPTDVGGLSLLEQLFELSRFYRENIGYVLERLNTPPPVTGLTFGIDVGRVARATIFQEPEWVGRPINVACRLQGAVKECEGSPAYKALVTNPFYMRYLNGKGSRFPVESVTRNLRNVSGGADFQCRQISLPPPPYDQE